MHIIYMFPLSLKYLVVRSYLILFSYFKCTIILIEIIAV